MFFLVLEINLRMHLYPEMVFFIHLIHYPSEMESMTEQHSYVIDTYIHVDHLMNHELPKIFFSPFHISVEFNDARNKARINSLTFKEFEFRGF